MDFKTPNLKNFSKIQNELEYELRKLHFKLLFFVCFFFFLSLENSDLLCKRDQLLSQWSAGKQSTILGVRRHLPSSTPWSKKTEFLHQESKKSLAIVVCFFLLQE
jgi:hypothetical protein